MSTRTSKSVIIFISSPLSYRNFNGDIFIITVHPLELEYSQYALILNTNRRQNSNRVEKK